MYIKLYYNIINLSAKSYVRGEQMNTELAEIIHLNNINEEVLYSALHKDILESILSEICEYMKKDESAYLSTKKIYYRSAGDIDAIVFQYGNRRFCSTWSEAPAVAGKDTCQ